MSPSNAVVAGAFSARGRPSRALSLSPAIAKLLVLLVQIPLSYAAPLIPRALRVLEAGEPEPKSPDDPDLWVYLGTAVALVLLGGAFAGLTIALMGQDEIYLQVISESGEGSERKHAKKVLNLLKKGKHWVLVTLLLSNVITNETLPIVLDRSLGGGWPAVVSSTVLIVIFGEIAPQSVCVRYGLPIGAWMSPFVLILMWLMAPVAWPTAKLLDYLLGEDHGTTYKKAGLKTLVTLHKSLGSATERLNEDEVTIISAVLDLKDKSVGDIMTPMGDVFTMSADTVLDEKMMDTILSQGYSRIPVYAPENPRNFIGMLLVKILITYDPEDCLRVRDFALATLPETAPHTSCLDIVNFFQEGKSHMVLVSDFPGQDRGALGVLTLEDVIEELIGEEIIDESDVFVDVHRAIRRVQPAPRMKYNRDVSRDTNKDRNQADTDQESEVEASETEGLLAKKAPSRKSSLNEPRETTFLIRRPSDGSTREQRPPVAVRSNTQDLRSQLRHLGPSNVASRPKTTKYTSVKIKPGVGTIPEGGVPSPTGNAATPRSVNTNSGPDGGAGAGLLHDAAGDAKDGAQAVSQGYGTMGNNEPIRIENEHKLDEEISAEGASSEHAPQSAAEASAQAAESAKHGRTSSPEPTESNQQEPEQAPEPEPQPSDRRPSPPAPEKLVVPSGESRSVSQNGRRGSESSQSTVGELQSRPQKPKRSTRSGSITESVVDVGGMKKVVLETTSSSDAEDGQKDAGDANGDDKQDDDTQAEGGNDNGGSKKKKKKKRGGKKAREKEAKKNNSGDSTPLLGRRRSCKIVDLDMPEPGPGDVLINLSHSGVCHSDLGVMTNRWAGLPHPTQPGQVGGHEGVGKIVKMGPGTENSSVKVGDRVGIKWISAICGSCPACLSGHDGVCFNQKVSGYYTPGTFQQYVTGPASYVTPIPESLASDAAAPMLCAGVTVYSALRKSGAQSGDWIALLGAGGGLGHLACQIASKGMGMRVIGIDAGEKKDIATECGAEVFIDHTKGNAEEEVKKVTGGLGVQAVLVLTAANGAYASGMGLLKFGGTLVCVGLPEGELKPIATAFPQLMVAKAQRIVGVAVGDRREAIETLEFAERGIVKTHFSTIKMDQLTKTFEEMDAGKLKGRVVLDLSS